MSALTIVTRLLLNASPVTAVVGDKVRSYGAEQGLTTPFLVLNLAGGDDEQMLDGAGKYRAQRVSIEAISGNRAQANSLGDLIIDALGDVVKETVFGAGSPAPVIAVDVDVFEAGADLTDSSDDRSTFRRVIDFSVRWRKP